MAYGADRPSAISRLVLVEAVALLVATALLAPMATANPGTTELVNVDSAGVQANGFSLFAAISADGRFIAFRSAATNLVPGDTNGAFDIFVHERQTGTTERVSIDSAGAQANGSSEDPSISGDGRFVAFHSAATNLVAGDSNGWDDIFVHDRQTGTTERMGGTQDNQANSFSQDAAISADGQSVAFRSAASNLVLGDTNDIDDVFVTDRRTGVTERVSVDSAGFQADSFSDDPALSADGRFVTFRSLASDLVPGDDNGDVDAFVHDRQTGLTEMVSVHPVGFGHTGFGPAISADGRFVAFSSNAPNLVPDDTNVFYDVFVRDRETGITERVSVDSDGLQANDESADSPVAISASGRFVAFASFASNLVDGDTNGGPGVLAGQDVFVHDRLRRDTERVSVDSTGGQANGGSGSRGPAMSADGRFVAFESAATNLVAGDSNGWDDIFVHDRGLSDNTPPVLTMAGGQCLSDTKASARADLIVGDAESAPGALSVSATSSNQTLLPNANLVTGGNAANRTLTLTAAPNRSGTATITLAVSDGSDTTTLVLTVKVGTPNNDTISGTSTPDVLFGLGGRDTLDSGSGNDLLCGGNGNDTLNGGDGNDVLDGGRGSDTLNGGNNDDRLLGNANADMLTGGVGADFFSGGSGADTSTDFNAGEGDTTDGT